MTGPAAPLSDFGSEHTEFGTGVVTGVRMFDVDDDGRLHGVTWSSYVWQPGVNVAGCYLMPGANTVKLGSYGGAVSPVVVSVVSPAFAFGPHVPTGRCDQGAHGCGFWAYHDGSEYPIGDVAGVIQGWGKTSIGTRGFRAEHARIVALALPGYQWRWRSGITVLVMLLNLIMGVLATSVGKPGSAAFYFTMVAIFAAYLWFGDVLPAREARVQARKVRAAYPDVPVYQSVKTMTAAHPLDPTLGSPERAA